MKRGYLIYCLLLLLPLAALADGKVIPAVAFPAEVSIPDQRALIGFSNGMERLVIETRFTGEGSNFAWIVPLPSQPVIEEATTGLFPTLDYLFQPEIEHDIEPYFIWALIFAAVGYVLFRSWRSGVLETVAVLLLLLILTILLLPGLATAGAKSKSPMTHSEVSVLDRKIAGVFDTATLAAREPKALSNWLRQNGFAAIEGGDSIIADYMKKGWVFVATKIRRDNPKNETSTPHPLSFTFKTDRPVYPMRLTGLGNNELKVELYVFGPDRAAARHFKVERCTRPKYPKLAETDNSYWRGYRSPGVLNIVHPLLRKCVDGLPVATKLSATLGPAEMQQDVWLDWKPFSEKKNRLFSTSAARIICFNFGSGLFAISLLATWIFTFDKDPMRVQRRKLVAFSLAGSLLITALLYLGLPKTEVRLVKVPSPRAYNVLQLFHLALSDEITNSVMLPEAQAKAKSIINDASTNFTYWSQWERQADWTNLQNYLIGGRFREEDSPGNYILRQTNGVIEVVAYDAQGAEHARPLHEFR